MKMFPDGAGFAALIFLIISVIIIIISAVKHYKKAVAVSLVVMLISGGYLAYGVFTLYCHPYLAQGEALFASGIMKENFYYYAKNFDSAKDFADDLLPEAKAADKSSVVNESPDKNNIEYKVLNTENSTIEITTHSFESAEEAKEAYLDDLEQQKSIIPQGPGSNYCLSDNISYVISSIAYDGVKFLLPFKDSDGARLMVCLYLGDSYVFISEKAEDFDKITLPDIINEKSEGCSERLGPIL